MATQIPTIDVLELKRMLDDGEDFVLLDVREPDEYDFCRIEGSLLIPLGQVAERCGELDPQKKLIVMCKAGGRSAQATCILREKGFDAANLAGGITAWSERVDPSVPKY